jgi:muramoyltetrapeptide carboxypeptidase
MTTPPYLKPGDTIGIVSPAKSISAEAIENASRIVEGFGFVVKVGKHAASTYHQFAGTDNQRTEDFQQMLDDDEVKIILCSRGGYGSVRIIDKLDFNHFQNHPKWIVGFSDITVFHSHLFSNFGIESLHAKMPLNFPENGVGDQSVGKLFSVLAGGSLNYEIPAHLLNRTGKAEARLIGGNLSILCSLLGSRSDSDTEGKILFIEEVGENLYRLDRMMWTLKRAGKLDNLAGLVVGGLTDMEDNDVIFGKSAEEIIAEAVSEFSYPVCFNFPAGHQKENYPLIIGRTSRLKVDKNKALLNFNPDN